MATIGTVAFLVLVGIPIALIIAARFQRARGLSKANDR